MSAWRDLWSLPDDVAYLNHGSFGPSPLVVQGVRRRWSEELESQPMDFFVRRLEEHLDQAAERLGRFVGASRDELAFVENATAGMNVVAASTPLAAGDEVLLTDHEYGAVARLWRMRCAAAGARVVTATLPLPWDDEEQLLDALFAAVTERTRLIVVRHVTSPTALVLPVAAICRRARSAGVAVCVDGPHAVAMLPLDISRIDCDFYTASCHKWLSAPFGSGFLYVARRRWKDVKPAVVSWGGSVSGRPASWKDEFNWVGTRDPAAFLAVPAAIDFLEETGLETFREHAWRLLARAREAIVPLTGHEPLGSPGTERPTMLSFPLPPLEDDEPPVPPGRPDPLQQRLWSERRIEVPVTRWSGRRLLRVSCHLYNTEADIDRLAEALRAELPRSTVRGS
ncbi:MAG: aminotransferase class V-fold PLP-dependent enzyme [Planctomycetes bacterium]|nr:aminotransferase class V-fold PLP-dependent enzyme [Planctomycetota bacterium]